MGKRSMKISTKDTTKQLQNLNSLMLKAVKPKVYITDSSSFKTLVQELTGNSTPSTQHAPPDHETIMGSPPSFFDSSTSDDQSASFEFEKVNDLLVGNDQVVYNLDDINTTASSDDQMIANNSCFEATSFDSNEGIDMFVCQDIESLLFDIDQHAPFCTTSTYAPSYQELEEFENYNYAFELSELL